MNPTIAAVQALDGKIFAMLTVEENEVLQFYRDQGRKFGVTATIVSAADPAELAKAGSQQQADEIMRRVNSTVSVTVTGD